jgi:hypothetical protein
VLSHGSEHFSTRLLERQYRQLEEDNERLAESLADLQWLVVRVAQELPGDTLIRMASYVTGFNVPECAHTNEEGCREWLDELGHRLNRISAALSKTHDENVVRQDRRTTEWAPDDRVTLGPAAEPIPDPEMVEESLAAYRRGDYITTAQWLLELLPCVHLVSASPVDIPVACHTSLILASSVDE